MTMRVQRTCPRCGGIGKIPALLPSRQAAMDRSKTWAEQFDGQVVKLSAPHRKASPIIGVGVARKGEGGYWVVRLYTPEPIWTDPELSDHGYVYPITSRMYDRRAPYPFTSISYSFGEKLSVVPMWFANDGELEMHAEMEILTWRLKQENECKEIG